MNSSFPSLSVVVVTVYGSTYLEQCLLALEEQIEAPEDLEIIVAYNRNDDDVRPLKSRFQKVQFYFSPARQTQNALRSYGVENAGGRIVAITVDHCTVTEHWCRQILRAHEKPFAAIGGAIEKGTQPDTLSNWAVHIYDYCNYGSYLMPYEEGPASDLSDCNVSYKRDVLGSTSNIWIDDFNVSLLNKALLIRGETLWLSPEIIVHQHRNIAFKSASRIAFHRGRAFASARTVNSSENQRILYTIFSPLLPAILMTRLVKNVYRKKIHYRIILLTLPLIALFTFLWSWGEMITQMTLNKNINLPTIEE
jgi:hypothetical protein